MLLCLGNFSNPEDSCFIILVLRLELKNLCLKHAEKVTDGVDEHGFHLQGREVRAPTCQNITCYVHRIQSKGKNSVVPCLRKTIDLNLELRRKLTLEAYSLGELIMQGENSMSD